MIDIIRKSSKDPLGAMMLAHIQGRKDTSVEVDSTTLEMWTMNAQTMFRDYSAMDELEQRALELCRGKIVDVGAGSGCHSLYLQEKGERVEALDISPGCVQVMKKRGIANVFHKNLFTLAGKKYDTLLMLMNGLGICGTLDGCNLFLQFVKTILSEGGQVIADSTDLKFLYEEELYSGDDGYYGETEFIMKYGDVISDPFNWIYIDFDTLTSLAAYNGLQCEQVAMNPGGQYLARIF